MSDWEMKEKLTTFGGDLIVSKELWFIQKYYPGPDLRYNGDFFRIGGRDVSIYCQNLRKTWDKFQESLVKFEGEKNVELSGFGDSKIYIKHALGNGITEYRYHGIIHQRRTLDLICSEIENAPKRAAKIQDRMSNL